jgi:hypothetical protein
MSDRKRAQDLSLALTVMMEVVGGTVGPTGRSCIVAASIGLSMDSLTAVAKPSDAQ